MTYPATGVAWLIRVAILVLVVVGFTYADTLGNAFGDSTTATVGYVVAAVLLVAVMTWVAYRLDRRNRL